MKQAKNLTVLLTCAVLLLGTYLNTSVKAQEMNIVIDNMPRVIGVGIGIVPDYEGSDDYTWGAAPFAKFKLEDHEQYLLIKAYELQLNLLDHPWLRLGPSLNYHWGRDDDVEDHYVKKMKEIDGTVEAGGWFGVEFTDSTNPRKRFLADVDFLTDIGNEHDGYTISGNVRGWYPLSQMFDAGLGFTMVYASDNYMKTYFGVSPKDSARSGLPVFDADSGVKDIRINPVLVMHLNTNWHVAAGIQYRRLLGDADDSPVVDKRGSSNQWISGLGLAYSW